MKALKLASESHKSFGGGGGGNKDEKAGRKVRKRKKRLEWHQTNEMEDIFFSCGIFLSPFPSPILWNIHSDLHYSTSTHTLTPSRVGGRATLAITVSKAKGRRGGKRKIAFDREAQIQLSPLPPLWNGREGGKVKMGKKKSMGGGERGRGKTNSFSDCLEERKKK